MWFTPSPYLASPLVQQAVRKSVESFASLKVMPKRLAKFLISTGLVNLLTDFFKYSKKTLKEVLDELTDNKELKAVLAYNFGDYGEFLLLLFFV